MLVRQFGDRAREVVGRLAAEHRNVHHFVAKELPRFGERAQPRTVADNLEIDGDMNTHVESEGAEPMIFAPDVQVFDVFGVAERRACRVVGQHRSTQRHQRPSPPPDEAKIREELRAFAKKRPRWGWRRAAIHLRKAGWRVNNKRVRRLWREEGLSVPVRRKKRRLTGRGVHVGAMSLIAPNALWALDFQFDHTIDHRQVKMLNIIDEYTREALAIRVEHSIVADDVVATLDRLVIERGRPPAFVRFDNGPEFVADAVAEWCNETGVNAIFIDPGSPWQNAWIESFNSRLRDELLNLWQFDSLLEAQVLIEDWGPLSYIERRIIRTPSQRRSRTVREPHVSRPQERSGLWAAPTEGDCQAVGESQQRSPAPSVVVFPSGQAQPERRQPSAGFEGGAAADAGTLVSSAVTGAASLRFRASICLGRSRVRAILTNLDLRLSDLGCS